MDTHSFLASVLPTEGYYLVASYSQKNPSANEEHIVDTIDEMVRIATEIDGKGKDAYFALGTLANRQEKQIDKQTGETMMVKAGRKKNNIKYISVLFVEIDVEPSGLKNKKPCYTSKDEAYKDLKKFCKKIALPKPTVIDSGGGIHAYWRMDGNVAPTKQNTMATLLKTLVTTEMHRVADVGIMTDYARVLRVPNTHNYKQEIPRPTSITQIGTSIDVETLHTLLEDKSEELGITVKKRKYDVLPEYLQDVKQTIGLSFEDIPPLRFDRVLAICPQIKWAYDNPNGVSEPYWLGCIRTLQKCDGYEQVIHDFSKGYDNYSKAETDKKIIHVVNNYSSPMTCASMENNNPKGCDGCEFKDKGSSPAWHARDVAIAPPPVLAVVTEIEGVEVTSELSIENPPSPFARTKDGRIVMLIGDDNETAKEITISKYDTYPIVRRREEGKDEYTVWHTHTTDRGWIDIEIPSSMLADPSALYKYLLRFGIYYNLSNIKPMQMFMIAYLNHIQKSMKAESVHNRFGWHDATFVLGNKTFHPDGEISLSSAKKPLPYVGTAGSLEAWVKAMEFYDDPEYDAQKFAILSGWAAPLWEFTNFSGILINIDGVPGAGKSTVVSAAISMYGQGVEKNTLMQNGGKGGFTLTGLYEQLHTLQNLPLGFDEITTLESTALAELVHQFSQGQGRLRSKTWSTEKENWKTPIISTSNGSIFQKISISKSDAMGEAVRVFEIYLSKNHTNSKRSADDLLRVLQENYGHAGELNVGYITTHQDRVRAEVYKQMERIDVATGDDSAERFRTALVALVGIQGVIAKKLGLVKWDIDRVVLWGINHMKNLRNIVNDYIQTPVDVLSNFLDENRSGTLIIQGVNGSKHVGAGTVEFLPTIRVVARHELDIGRVYIKREAMQEYCGKIKADHKFVENELKKMGVLVNPAARKSLGANTMLDKVVGRCWEIDLLHESISEKAPELLTAMRHLKTLSEEKN